MILIEKFSLNRMIYFLIFIFGIFIGMNCKMAYVS